jgi:DNA-binding GntR family transcriptional regulator
MVSTDMVSTETEPLVKEHLAGQLKDAVLQGRLSPGRRGRSARVPRYTQEDVARIYQVRGALEGLAGQLASASAADLAQHSVGRFAASAQAVWRPEASPKRRRKS